MFHGQNLARCQNFDGHLPSLSLASLLHKVPKHLKFVGYGCGMQMQLSIEYLDLDALAVELWSALQAMQRPLHAQ